MRALQESIALSARRRFKSIKLKLAHWRALSACAEFPQCMHHRDGEHDAAAPRRRSHFATVTGRWNDACKRVQLKNVVCRGDAHTVRFGKAANTLRFIMIATRCGRGVVSRRLVSCGSQRTAPRKTGPTCTLCTWQRREGRSGASCHDPRQWRT